MPWHRGCHCFCLGINDSRHAIEQCGSAPLCNPNAFCAFVQLILAFLSEKVERKPMGEEDLAAAAHVASSAGGKARANSLLVVP